MRFATTQAVLLRSVANIVHVHSAGCVSLCSLEPSRGAAGSQVDHDVNGTILISLISILNVDPSNRVTYPAGPILCI